MTLKDYLNNLYTIKPLPINCDISNAAVVQALVILEFKLEEDKEYKLYITRGDLQYIQQVVNCPLKITVQLDETLDRDAFYVVDEAKKTLVYSPGALPLYSK